jgi:hypothetical protein
MEDDQCGGGAKRLPRRGEARRENTRINRKSHMTATQRENAYKKYREKRRDLRKKTKAEKERRWKELCNDSNRNTWGDAFKIACGKLRILPSVTLSDEDLTREAKKLFPNHTVKAWNFLERRPECECPQITEDEIKTAVELLKIRKAPGPDGIPPEIMKLAVKYQKKATTKMINYQW